ncbi:MAG: type IV pilus biogenesis/stability protein PilW [Thiohalomonadaceae bacterium]
MKKSLIVLAAALLLSACSGMPTRDPRSAQVNAELGLRYMLQGQNEIALEKLNRALEQDPKSPVAHHYLAELYRRLGESEDADRHFRRAIDLDDTNSSIYNNYGVFLCNEKRYEEAEKQFLKVLANPVYAGRAQTLENLGVCMRAAGDSAKATEYFRKALQADPKSAIALLGMAELSHAAGNALSARAYLQRYNEVGPHTPESLWLGVRVERALGNKGAAGSYGLLLKNRFPDSQEAGRYLRSEQP